MTRDKIVERLANVRTKRHYLANLTRAQVRQAAQGFSDADWDNIIESVRAKNPVGIGNVIYIGVLEFLHAKAVVDVEAALGADDTLTITELEDLL